jgi:phytanoyl-CoA hydroxylase
MVPFALRAQVAHARARVERGLRSFLHGGQPSWRRLPNRRPWFDQADASSHVADHAASPEERVCFEQWIRDGYFVVRDVVDPADLDAMTSVLDGLWESDAAVPGLVLLDLRESPDAPARNVPHDELLALPPETRARLRAASDWRIHGFHYHDAAARRIFGSGRLRGLVSRLFGRRAQPFAAINFMTGSQQHLHQDMAVFHIYPHDFLVGAWIACEDVRADCGPLVLHPGSHRSGMFPGFADYPQSNLRTADDATAAAYQRWVDDVAARHPGHEFLARKGDVLVWHGMLVHGGAPVLRPGSTRKSMVIHYTVRGADRTREVHGPFNW